MAQQAAATPQKADGKAVYDKVCVACHQVSVANSPKLGDRAAWAPRTALVTGSSKGIGASVAEDPPSSGGAPPVVRSELSAAVSWASVTCQEYPCMDMARRRNVPPTGHPGA